MSDSLYLFDDRDDPSREVRDVIRLRFGGGATPLDELRHPSVDLREHALDGPDGVHGEDGPVDLRDLLDDRADRPLVGEPAVDLVPAELPAKEASVDAHAEEAAVDAHPAVDEAVPAEPVVPLVPLAPVDRADGPAAIEPIVRPAGVPASPVDRERTRVAATRLLAALVAVLVLVAAVVTGILLVGGDSGTSSGSVVPTAAAYLDFARSGTVADVLVKPGDHVRAGEVLAEQSSTDLQAKLAADQATLYADQAHALELGGGGSDAAAQVAALVQQANAQLASAKAKVAGSVSGAQSTVAAATARLQQAQSTDAAARASYAGAQASCNAPGRTAQSSPSDAECAQIRGTLAANASAVENASQALAQAQLALQTAQTASAQQLALANSAAALAATPTTRRSTTATSGDVAAANAAVSRDIAAVAADQAAIAGSRIVAPADGVVGSIGAQAGDYVTPGGARTYAPTSSSGGTDGFQLFSAPSAGGSSGTAGGSGLQPVVVLYSTTMHVTAQVSERDVTKRKVGEKAKVTLPALGNHAYDGVVAAVNPTAVSRDGKVYYLVDVTLADASPAGVMPGMTADVSFG